MTKIIILAIVKLVTPKAGAKHELLFNKPASASLENGKEKKTEYEQYLMSNACVCIIELSTMEIYAAGSHCSLAIKWEKINENELKYPGFTPLPG